VGLGVIAIQAGGVGVGAIAVAVGFGMGVCVGSGVGVRVGVAVTVLPGVAVGSGPVTLKLTSQTASFAGTASLLPATATLISWRRSGKAAPRSNASQA
jgi:hypothetical protein